MGYVVGELAFVAAAVAFLLEEGRRGLDRRTAVIRRVLLVLHLGLVLVGIEAALAVADVSPQWLGVATRLGNVFSFCLVPLVVIRGYPLRLGEMLNETLAPLGYGAVWAGVRVVLEGGGEVDWARALLEPVVFLGLHHLAVVGPLFVSLLLKPPGHAMASALSPKERLTSGFGLFWVVTMALWCTQAVYAMVVLGRYALGFGALVGAVGIGLFLVSVGRSVWQVKRLLVPSV